MKNFIYSMTIIGLGLLQTFAFLNAAAAARDEYLEYYQKGEDAFVRGNYELAIEFYERVVEHNPNFAPVYNSLGLAHIEIDAKSSDIVWFFNVAIDIDPKNADAYNNLCRYYYQQRQFDEAEQACLDTLEVNPNSGSASLTLAWTYLMGQQKPEKAIYYFNKLVPLVENDNVYFGLGMAYAMNGEHAKVLEIITTLRDRKADELASQLENSLRRASPETQPTQPVPQDSLFPQQQQASTLIPSGQETPVVPEEQTGSAGTGTMRIRLRGQLTGMGGTAPTGAAAPQQSTQTQQTPTPRPKTAAERIRELQLLRQGIGGGTNVQGGY